MSFIDRIDPELVRAFDLMPAERFAAIEEDPPRARQLTEAYQRILRDALPKTDVTIEETSFPGPDCEIPVVIYQPPKPAPRGDCCGCMVAAISWARRALTITVLDSPSTRAAPSFQLIIAWRPNRLTKKASPIVFQR